MPAEARHNIHLLFDKHDTLRRTVEMTAKGFTAVTESEDPAVAAALKSHVQQMSERLKAGLPVRRHDPAFAELFDHRNEIEMAVTPTDKGLRVVVTGTTPAGIRVAQNHAAIVSDFAAHGWDAHNRDHPKALSSDATSDSSSRRKGSGCCQGGKCCLEKEPVSKPSQKTEHH